MLSDTLIFTDLDGTLLDHGSYSYAPALPMIEYIKNKGIPLIIVTSKTKGEVIELQNALGISDPFIIENGAGVFIPEKEGYTMIALGALYAETRRFFEKYAETVPMRGFFDMSVDEIAQRTGLSHDAAAKAKERTFSEPFVLEDDGDLEPLKALADEDGFDIVKGGRFYHLITKGQDKASAIKKVMERYEKASGTVYKSIALGDSENDLTMLQSVDTPILVPHLDGSYIPCDITSLVKAPFPGPKGWNEALKEYFNVQ